MTFCVTALLGWGVFAFGAVYPWAYGVIALGIAGSAMMNIRSVQIRRPGMIPVCLGLLVLACGLQLVSLPVQTLEQLSPATPRFLRKVNFIFASGLIDRHAASIDPPRSFRALSFILFGATWAWVCASLATRTREFPHVLARNLLALGVVVAVVGLVQRATFNGKLLWFWEPMFYSTNAFGPFVNRNHFAGWMLLALMIGIGYLFGMLTKIASNVSTWRDRLLWVGSSQGMAVILAAIAIVVMGCSLVWTMSRSGIAAAGIGASMLFAAAVYRSKHRMLRVALAGYLALAVVGIVAWRGTDTLFAWYGDTKTLEWRFVLWQDTIPALKDFWVTGSGLNTYGTLMTGYPHTYTDLQPREAHSDYLQLAVEGGLLLCIPVLLLVIGTARRTLQRLLQPQNEMTWWIRMGAVAGMCGIAVQELTEFSLQIPGVALLFATCVALALHEPAQVVSRRRSHRKAETAVVPVL